MKGKPAVSVELLEAITSGLLASRQPNASTASRCLSGPALRRLLVELRTSAGKRQPSADVLIGHLVRAQILQPLEIEKESRKSPSELYLIGPDVASTVHPIELLSAAVPGGVACYFTAMSFYSLTTQHPPHHHIARLRADSTSAARVHIRPGGETHGAPAAPSYDVLGTHLFSRGGLAYYVTSRSARWMPGVKSRFLHSTACIRITSLEQTLIDSLHRSLSCGGPPVIFEAWATALDEPLADVEELERLILAIGDDRVARRVAYMLDVHGCDVPGGVLALIETARTRAEFNVLPLFPGYDGGSVDQHLQLRVP